MPCTTRRLVGTIVIAALLLQSFAGSIEWLRVQGILRSHVIASPAPAPPVLLPPENTLPPPPPPPLPLTSPSPPPPQPTLSQPPPRRIEQHASKPAKATTTIATAPAAATATNSSCGGVQRRLLHWNILDGGGSRMDGIAQFVADGAYDVVTMNELNGYDQASLARLGKRCGLPHTQVLAKSNYHLGVLSRHPLTPLASERGPEFAHGLLCVRVLGVSLCVTHLNPHDVTRRATEARRIIKRHARAPLDTGAPFMLVGDLNTLSPLDAPSHEEADLTRRIRSGPYSKPLSKKFLTKSKDGVDYTPMQLLLDGPLTDVGARTGHSVPTGINADKMHFATLRLDYCLVSAAVLDASACRLQGADHGRRAGVRAVLLRDERTNALSDHFPLEVTFVQPPHWAATEPEAPRRRRHGRGAGGDG